MLTPDPYDYNVASSLADKSECRWPQPNEERWATALLDGGSRAAVCIGGTLTYSQARDAADAWNETQETEA